MAKEEHPAQKGVDHRRSVMEKQNDEYYARSAASRPTPTQEENDRAKVGMPVDPEPDGSEPEHVAVKRVMESRMPGGSPYDTRAMGTGTVVTPAPKPQPQPAPHKPKE